MEISELNLDSHNTIYKTHHLQWCTLYLLSDVYDTRKLIPNIPRSNTNWTKFLFILGMRDYRLSIVIMAKIKFILPLKIVISKSCHQVDDVVVLQFDGINFVKDVLVSSIVITISHWLFRKLNNVPHNLFEKIILF